ncbi:Hsp20 family protein [Methylocapsa acidiphila]|uniref:Probable small heat shock protein hspH n=1 Tax=Methylocapsa acidiphila TaxID=133552 RepID=Q2VNM9_METAI|nr:Hsp20 family protein [Methylocapsa acidiphila]CAJ01603.1 probable small heat shock protein hspH [Methylocapsa acidiphila]
MSRAPNLKSPFLLAFDEIERAAERAAKAVSNGYPPCNIERIVGGETDEVRLRITLAVAGFAADQLEVAADPNELTIRGRQKDERARTYLHRGIAARQFQRVFRFAEAMEVAEASLQDGLLSVELIRPEPRGHVKRVAINVRD